MHPVASRSLGRIDGGVRPAEELLAPDSQRVAGRHADAAGQCNRLTEALHAHFGNPVENTLRDRMR
jgi:hypothetical protein